MIPDYQSLMLPLLEKLADKREHVFRDLVEELAVDFKVSEDERKELLPSGTQRIFDNRVGWARTYLKKAELIESPNGVSASLRKRDSACLNKTPSISILPS